MPPRDSLTGPYAALQVRAFRLFIGSMLAMTVAAQIQAVVVGWLIYQATRDPLSLGLIGLAEVIPYLAIALWAGHVVDRSDRRRVSLWSLIVLCVAAAAALGFALSDGSETLIWPWYAIIAVCGLARAFLQVARSALVSEIVPPSVFANAATWRSSTWQAGMVLGPALGGLMLAVIGARATFAVNLVLAGLSLLAMALVTHRPTPRAAHRASALRTLAEGLAFLRANRVILAALALDMVAVLFGGAVALMPVFAVDILGVGPKGLGMLQGAPGAGAVLMAIVLAHRPPFRRAGRALLIAVVIFGVCIIGFGLSRSFALSVFLLFISGAADNVSAVIRSTLIQVLVPPEMLGRISAVNAIFIGSSNELGAFESGVAARLIGTVPAVVLGGVVAIGTVIVTAWRVPGLRNLGEIGRDDADEARGA